MVTTVQRTLNLKGKYVCAINKYGLRFIFKPYSGNVIRCVFPVVFCNCLTVKMGDNDHNLIFVGLVCAVLFVAYFINLSQKTTPTVNVPLELPRMKSDGDHDQFQNGDFVWGTYRPNVYFGVKPRVPDGPVFGLLWFRQYPDKESPKASKFRHYCNSGVGEIDKFGWIRHDGKNFGMQKITEKHMKLTTSFVKRNGGKHGGDWSARISGKPLDTHVSYGIKLKSLYG